MRRAGRRCRAPAVGTALVPLSLRLDDIPQGCRGRHAALRARHLVWPSQHREAGAALHAKVLVVDRQTVLVGSANLTGHGLERNLECGLLVRGGPVPERIVAHLYSIASFFEVPE